MADSPNCEKQKLGWSVRHETVLLCERFVRASNVACELGEALDFLVMQGAKRINLKLTAEDYEEAARRTRENEIKRALRRAKRR